MKRHNADAGKFVWLDGELIKRDRASVSVADRGLLFGDGLFETIRSDFGRVHFLGDHLDRLRTSSMALRIEMPERHIFTAAINGLLEKNSLVSESARIRITMTRGDCAGLGLPATANPTILITADRYVQPTPEEYERGWRLVAFEGGFATPLAAHKTLNYLFFLQARQVALDRGCDEAVVLGPRGEVAEATTGSILVCQGGRWATPDCTYRLPGITLRRVVGFLADRGIEVASTTVSLSDLYGAETIWILNSLMGVMPASELNLSPLKKHENNLAREARDHLFAEP